MQDKRSNRKTKLIKGHFGSLFFFLFSLLFSNLSLADQSLDITTSPNYAALVVNSDSGSVIYSRHAHNNFHPASLVKLIDIYLAFEALESGRLTMRQKLYVSERAAMQPKSKLGLKAGEKISVRDCIYALIIKSANDAAVVLAEAIGGSEWNFVQKMNKKAKELGMTKTHFVNSHGLHDSRQITSAVDMAKLAMALMKHYPKYYPMFSKTSFYYKNKIIKGHNHVMTRYNGAEGLKTGYVRASGYNLVTTARKPQGHLIAVVFGGQSAKVRDDHMISLLNNSFNILAQKRSMRSNLVANSTHNILNKPEITTPSGIFSVLDQNIETKVASLNNSELPQPSLLKSTSAAKKVVRSNAQKAKKTYLSHKSRSKKPTIKSTPKKKLKQ